MNKLRTHILMLTIALPMLTACEKLDADTTPKAKAESDNLTETPAYSVADIVKKNYTDTDGIAVEGYIVGFVNGNNMAAATFAAGTIESNILLADTPTELDYQECIPIQLSNTTAACNKTRKALNLADNPAMLHQRVRLQGNIDSYMGVKGIRQAHNHRLLETPENIEQDEPTSPTDELNEEQKEPTNEPSDFSEQPEDSEQPDDYEQPDNSEQSGNSELQDIIKFVNTHGYSEETAYTVTEVKTYFPTFLSMYGHPDIGASGLSDSYVKGYIVGYIPSNYNIAKTIFSAGNINTNIVIADSPDETNPARCMAVQLSTGSVGNQTVRQTLNLADHPENLGIFVILMGDIQPYKGALGLENTTEVIIYP